MHHKSCDLEEYLNFLTCSIGQISCNFPSQYVLNKQGHVKERVTGNFALYCSRTGKDTWSVSGQVKEIVPGNSNICPIPITESAFIYCMLMVRLKQIEEVYICNVPRV